METPDGTMPTHLWLPDVRQRSRDPAPPGDLRDQRLHRPAAPRTWPISATSCWRRRSTGGSVSPGSRRALTPWSRPSASPSRSTGRLRSSDSVAALEALQQTPGRQRRRRHRRLLLRRWARVQHRCGERTRRAGQLLRIGARRPAGPRCRRSRAPSLHHFGLADSFIELVDGRADPRGTSLAGPTSPSRPTRVPTTPSTTPTSRCTTRRHRALAWQRTVEFLDGHLQPG